MEFHLDIDAKLLPAFDTFAQFALWMATTEELIDLRRALAAMHDILVRNSASYLSTLMSPLRFLTMSRPKATRYSSSFSPLDWSITMNTGPTNSWLYTPTSLGLGGCFLPDVAYTSIPVQSMKNEPPSTALLNPAFDGTHKPNSIARIAPSTSTTLRRR